jgi:hypothetical protein
VQLPGVQTPLQGKGTFCRTATLLEMRLVEKVPKRALPKNNSARCLWR